MFNTRLEESLQKYTTGNNLLLAERWTECCKRDFLSLMFTFYDSHLCFSFITGREKSIQVIGSGTAYLISAEPCIWGTQAGLTVLLAVPCAFFHMQCDVLFSKKGKNLHSIFPTPRKTHLSTQVWIWFKLKVDWWEGENRVVCLKGEENQQKHKCNTHNMKKRRSKMW